MILSTLLAAVATLGPLLSATPWVNGGGPPPTTGRVTLVDVFAFSCINCKHVTPELRKLRAEYGADDLAIAGVHTPELPEEKVHANLVQALKDQDITWPVVYDDAYQLWNTYGVSAWPTQLVFDRHGKLRATYVGEGYDTQLEQTIHKLVAERP